MSSKNVGCLSQTGLILFTGMFPEPKRLQRLGAGKPGFQAGLGACLPAALRAAPGRTTREENLRGIGRVICPSEHLEAHSED